MARLASNTGPYTSVIGIADYIDMVKWRSKLEPAPEELAFLQHYSSYARYEFSSPLSETGNALLKRPWLVTTVMPEDRILQLYGNDDYPLIYVEKARDLITPTMGRAWGKLEEFDEHFVQLRHKGHHQHFESHGTYTKHEQRDGIWFCYYVPEDGSKLVVRRPCLHVELRAHGRRALLQLGLKHTGDLINLIRDADAFWHPRMIFVHIDVGRYGRWLSNKRSGARRQYSIPSDFRLGGRMLRKYGEPREFASYCASWVSRDESGKRVIPEYPPDHERRTPPAVTMQQMIDRYGVAAPFMRVVRGPISSALSQLFGEVPMEPTE